MKDTLNDSSGHPYKNARNMAAGSVRCYDAGVCAERGLTFAPFGVVEGLEENETAAVSKAVKLLTLKRFGFSPCMFLSPQRNPSEQTISEAIAIYPTKTLLSMQAAGYKFRMNGKAWRPAKPDKVRQAGDNVRGANLVKQ